MKKAKIITTFVMVVIVLFNIITVSASETDSEAWRKTLTIENPMYDTAVTISVNISKIKKKS